MKNRYLYIVVLPLIIFMIIGCSKQNSDSTNSTYAAGQGGSLARFAIVENYLYTVDYSRLTLFDISNNNAPKLLGSNYIGEDIETIFPRDPSTLFIGASTGMHIYDITDKDDPKILSTYEHVSSCDPVVANDKYAFVTLNSIANNFCFRGVNELHIIDITDLTNPKTINNFRMNGPQGLGLLDTLLFICDDKFEVYNIKDIKNVSNIEDIKITEADIKNATDVIPTQNSIMVIGDNSLKQYKFQDSTLIHISTIDF